MRQFWEGIPEFLRNRYFLIGLSFFVWMLFFDRNNLISQFRKTAELNGLERKESFFKSEIKSIEKDKEELFSSGGELEKFAREKYRMKRDNEDLYVIVEE